MNGKLLLIILSFFCVNNAFAQKERAGESIVAVERGAKETRQLKETMHRFDNALMMKNTEELKRLLSDKLEMIHSNGMVETKETLLKNIESGRLVYKTIEQAGEAEMKRYLGKKPGYLYDVERKLNVSGVLDNAEFNVQLTTSEQWREWKGKWTLIRRESKNRE